MLNAKTAGTPIAKNKLLAKLQANVAIVESALQGNDDQEMLGVIGIFVADTQGGKATVYELKEACDEFVDIGKVVREDYSLRYNYKTRHWEVEVIRPFNDGDKEERGTANVDFEREQGND